MSSSFEENMKNAFLILINRPKLEFFGTLAYEMKHVCLDKDTDVFAPAFTDGRVITYVKKNQSTNEIIFAVLHEIMHIISSHIQRRYDRDPFIWNIATDHVINRELIHIGETTRMFQFPENLVFLKDIHQSDPEITSEQLYDLLLNNSNNYEITTKDLGNNVVEITIKDKKNGKTYKSVLDVDITKTGNPDVDKILDDLRNARDRGKQLWHSGQCQRGTEAGDISFILDELFKIEIPWDQVLENALLYSFQCTHKRSWTQKNIYMRNLKVTGEQDSGTAVHTLITVVDTSGSISDEDIKRFFGVILGSFGYFRKLIVLIHDVPVHKEIMVENAISPLGSEYFLEEIKKFQSRGGTSHLAAFNRIQELEEESDISISSIIFLTDFESDVQNIYHDFEFMYNYETIWVLNRKNPIKLTGCDTKTIEI